MARNISMVFMVLSWGLLGANLCAQHNAMVDADSGCAGVLFAFQKTGSFPETELGLLVYPDGFANVFERTGRSMIEATGSLPWFEVQALAETVDVEISGEPPRVWRAPAEGPTYQLVSNAGSLTIQQSDRDVRSVFKRLERVAARIVAGMENPADRILEAEVKMEAGGHRVKGLRLDRNGMLLVWETDEEGDRIHADQTKVAGLFPGDLLRLTDALLNRDPSKLWSSSECEGPMSRRPGSWYCPKIICPPPEQGPGMHDLGGLYCPKIICPPPEQGPGMNDLEGLYCPKIICPPPEQESGMHDLGGLYCPKIICPPPELEQGLDHLWALYGSSGGADGSGVSGRPTDKFHLDIIDRPGLGRPGVRRFGTPDVLRDSALGDLTIQVLRVMALK